MKIHMSMRVSGASDYAEYAMDIDERLLKAHVAKKYLLPPEMSVGHLLAQELRPIVEALVQKNIQMGTINVKKYMKGRKP